MQSLDSSIEIRDIRRRLYATAELWTRTPPNVHRRFLHVKSCRWHRTSCTVPVCTGMPVNMHRNRCPGIRKLARQLPVLYQRMPPTVCTFEQTGRASNCPHFRARHRLVCDVSHRNAEAPTFEQLERFWLEHTA